MSASSRRSYRSRFLLIASPLVAAGVLVTSSAMAQVTVQVAELRQTMDGFGASSAFFSEDISEEDAEFLFSEDTGIGLSLLRVRIHHEDAITMEIETAKKAKMWGARVWAAPWTPPPEWKTNGELNAKPMAHLRSQNFGDYANYLADFAEYMATEGVPLVAITPQNEPDWEADWDGCLWSTSEMVTFIGQHLGPVFEQRGLDVMIVAPDTAHLRNLAGFVDAILANADAKKYTAGISTHPYSAADFDMTWSVPRDNDMFFWQTEISQENFEPRDYPDPTMTSALTMVRMVHDHLTKLWMGAWNWWNLTAVTENYEDDPNRQNPALIQNGERFKRAYALGNYAKFVRPGFKRVEATPSPATDILVSAYRSDSRVVVVAVNASSAASSQTFTLEGDLGGTVADAVPWVTSDTLSLEAQTAVAISNGAFQYSLPAKSVTSFVVDIDVTVTGTGGMGGMAGTAGSGGVAGTGGVTTAGDGGVGGVASGGMAGIGGVAAAAGEGGVSASGGAPAAGAAGLGAGGVAGSAAGMAGTSGAGAPAGGAPTAGTGSGAAPAAGTGTSTPDDTPASEGCSCRTAGTREGSAARWSLAVLAVVLAFARRRARR
jgi:glucuronoarabinoxylan endo-1,4-beta-xylanase